MATTFVDVDVRPILRAGGEPFEKIMVAVAALKPGEGLRLFATFKPVPLLHMLGSKGFTYVANELPDGEWEVVFSPSETPSTSTSLARLMNLLMTTGWSRPTLAAKFRKFSSAVSL